MGDYLNPRIAAIRRFGPDLPRAMRGDPDDLGTAAVAEFLAPAVIITPPTARTAPATESLSLATDSAPHSAARQLEHDPHKIPTTHRPQMPHQHRTGTLTVAHLRWPEARFVSGSTTELADQE